MHTVFPVKFIVSEKQNPGTRMQEIIAEWFRTDQAKWVIQNSNPHPKIKVIERFAQDDKICAVEAYLSDEAMVYWRLKYDN